jgi:pimeloyl-ACP methyl ester carboxylesterase
VSLRVRNVIVDGGDLLLAEAGSGQPVVLIHGFAGTHRYWLGTLRRLAGAFRVLAVDVPGFGASDVASSPFDLLAAGERVLAASEQAGASRPVLVGHSLGGPIAALVAERHPDRVAGVVLVSSTGLSLERAWRRHVLLPAMHLALRRSRVWENLLASSPAARRVVFRDMLADPAALAPADARMLVGGAALARQLDGSLEASIACDLRSTLQRLQVPLGLVWGALDRTTPVADARLALALQPDARLRILEGAGHVPMLEQPAAFADALVAVLPEPPLHACEPVESII